MKRIIDTDELEKLEVKGSVSSYNQKGKKVTDLWISKAEVLELLANSPQADDCDMCKGSGEIGGYTSNSGTEGEYTTVNCHVCNGTGYKPQADEAYGQDFHLEYTCKRIRRLLNAMDMNDPSDGKDHVLMGMLFTLLGTICSKLEKPQADDALQWVKNSTDKEVIEALENCESTISYAVNSQADDVRKDAETAWLVEKDIGGFPNYLYCDCIGLLSWTPSNQKAMRFARKEDAESIVSIVEDADRIAQHMWLPAIDKARE